MSLFRDSKKADLNLSVQAIVILIFAVIMLGLGLGLINFIFGAAREKVGASLALTDLSIQPTSDKPVTIESKVTIKYKGEKEVQIGFYNSESNTLMDIFPRITQCQTASGLEVSQGSMPIVAASSKPRLDAGKGEGWKALITLPTPSGDAAESEGKYTGPLKPGTYICNVGIFGCTTPSNCKVDKTKLDQTLTDALQPINTADFTLSVTS